MADQYRVDIDVATQAAEKALKNFKGELDSAGKKAKETQKVSLDLKEAFKQLAAVFAAKEVFEFFKEGVDGAIEAKEATEKMNAALALSGEYSDAASKEMTTFADEIERTSKLTAEGALDIIAFAKGLGLTNDQAKNVTQAAVDMSTVLGVDANTAAEQLSQTLSGQAGRIGKLVPEIKNLTEAQLKAGVAVDIVRQKFAGASAAMINDYPGAVDQAKKATGNFQESLGDIIVSNPAVVVAIQEVAEIFRTLEGTVKDNEEGLKGFVKDAIVVSMQAFQGLVITTNTLIDSYYEFQKSQLALRISWNKLTGDQKEAKELTEELIKVSESSNAVNKATEKINTAIAQSVDRVRSANTKASDEFKKKLNEQGKATKALTDQYKDQEKETTNYFQSLKGNLETTNTEIEKWGKNAEQVLDIEQRKAEELADNAEAELEAAGKLTAANKEMIADYRLAAEEKNKLAKIKLQEEFNKKLAEEYVAMAVSIGEGIAEVFQGTISFAKDFLSGEYVNALADGVKFVTDIPKMMLEAFENLDQIVDGAVKAFNKLVGEVIDRLPALGEKIAAAIGPLMQKVAQQLPTLIRVMMRAIKPLVKTLMQDVIPTLIDAIPDMVIAFLDELPGIIEIIVQALPNIITKVAENLPIVIKALADALPGLIEILAENMDEIILALVEGMIGASGEIVAALITSFLVEGGLERMIKAIIAAIPKIAVALLEGILRGAGTAFQAIGGAIGGGIMVGLENLGDSIIAPIKEPINKFLELLNGAVIGPLGYSISAGRLGSWSGTLIPEVDLIPGNFPKLAEGGTMKRIPAGFNEDGGFFFGETDETVIDRTLTGQMREFFAMGGGQRGDGRMLALLEMILGELQKPIFVNCQVDVGFDDLKKGILQLSRNGARLTA